MGLTIQMGWYAEPITRTNEKFKELWRFLKDRKMDDWENVHRFASFFHPDYVFDQKSRAFRENAHSGSFLYRQMEKGEFDLKVIAAVAPSILESFPERVRGTPLVYREKILTVAANLACHEVERIDAVLEASPKDAEALARHLYWFERFAALWDRAQATRPPSLSVTIQKRTKAEAWHKELRKFHADFLKRNPRASMRRVVASFVKGGATGSGFRSKYDWARKHLK